MRKKKPKKLKNSKKKSVDTKDWEYIKTLYNIIGSQ